MLNNFVLSGCICKKYIKKGMHYLRLAGNTVADSYAYRYDVWVHINQYDAVSEGDAVLIHGSIGSVGYGDNSKIKLYADTVALIEESDND